MIGALLASAALLAPPVDIGPARDYAAHRPGSVAFAIRTEDGFAGVKVDRVFPSGAS